MTSLGIFAIGVIGSNRDPVPLICVICITLNLSMEGLSETQQESVRKMSSERIQGRLMRAGLPEEEVYDMSRPELMDKLATVMLSGDDPLVSVTSPGLQAEYPHEVQLRMRELELRERELQIQQEQMKMQMQLQQEQMKMQMQMHQEQIKVQQMRAEKEESMLAKTKRYGQAVQYALTKMPLEPGELPPWFDLVENVFATYGVPNELKGILILPYLTPRSKSLISRLSVADQESYPKLKEFLLKQHQLGSREYRARFLHASRNAGETFQSYCSRLHNLFRYYINSRACTTFDALFDVSVCDKLQDSLPPSNLKHCLAAAKDRNLKSEELATMADEYESNFFGDGRYKGLSVTTGNARVNNRFDNSQNFRGGKTPPGEKSNDEQLDQPRVGSHPVSGVSHGNNSNAVTRNLVTAESPGPKRKLFQTPKAKNSPIRCWTCGELGHTAKSHVANKAIPVNKCTVPDNGHDDNEMVQATVQVNHCSVVNPMMITVWK